jgi:hypothetical protein
VIVSVPPSRMPLTPLEARVLAAGQGRDAELHGLRKKSEGIVHTPPELARFIARAADELVVRELGAAAGLADASVALIDPACGPGAFFAAARAVASAREGAPGAVLGLDRDEGALERCRGAFADEPPGWQLALRCADTVQDGDPAALAQLGERLVVLGNPPWIGSAQVAASPRLEVLLEELRRDEDGVRLGEKKLGVLSDAYVRFFAFVIALARAARGGAVVGLVTNSSYLDGPVHRGLRGVLSRTFDSIDLIDLGGSALLARERMQRDGNVFGVRTPAAVLLAVRKPGISPQRAARVRYLRVHGTVDDKLAQLAHASPAALSLKPIASAAPAFYFVPERAAPPEYQSWPSLAELMPFHREGVQTNRDAAVIDASPERLCERLQAFLRGESREDMADAERALPHYDPDRARAALRSAIDHAGLLEALVCRIAYRPLDTRYFVPLAPLCHRPRADLLLAMKASSFALVVARKDRSAVPWRHIAASADITDNSFLSTRSSCRARGMPTHGPDGSENLDRAAVASLQERAGRVLSSREVACYALARLAEPSYQARYLAWLRVEYPRVPLPADARAFTAALRHGERLAEAWCAPLSTPLARLEGANLNAPLVVGHHHVIERQAKAEAALEGRGDRASVSAAAALRARAALLAALIAISPENSPIARDLGLE